MNQLELVTNKFRNELLTGNKTALNELAKAYELTWNKLRPELDAITKKYWQAKQAGEPISPSWLFRQERYKALMKQCEDELTQLSKSGANITNSQVKDAINMGQEHAQQLTLTALGEAPAGLSITWTKLPVKAVETIVSNLTDNSPVSKLLNRYGKEAAQGIKNELITGISMGKNTKVIAANIKRQFGRHLQNIDTVVHTETMRAYRTTQLQNYNENSNVVEAWIWHSALHGNSCIGCVSMHGTIHKLDDALEDHPSGKCSRIPTTKTWAELFPNLDLSHVKETRVQIKTGAELFKEFPDDKQLRLLGNTKYKAYKKGDLAIEDIAGVRHSDEWGDTVKIKNLSELGLK